MIARGSRVLQQSDPDDPQHQQVHRVKEVEKPFGEVPSSFRPLTVIKIHDDNPGQEDPHHTPYPYHTAGLWRRLSCKNEQLVKKVTIYAACFFCHRFCKENFSKMLDKYTWQCYTEITK